MALARRVGDLSSFSVSGIDDNELNLRWRKVLGSDGDDTITFNRIYQGGWGQLNLGDGHDTVVVSAEGDWTLLMIGVDEIYTDEASTTLTVISDATFDTNGSFTSYSAGYGTQVITFTGLVGDTEVSLGDSEDQVYFSNASTSWRYKAVDDDTVDVYDLSTGYRARLNGTNIENLVIEAGEDPDEAPVDVQLEEVPSDAEGGTSIAVTVPEPSENDPDPIIFDSTSIRFTPQLGGWANAYGYLKNQNNGLGTSPTDGFYYGYYNYMQNLGFTRLTRGVESTIDLNGADKYYYSSYYNQGIDGDRSDPLAYRTTANKAFDGWLSVYLQDTDGNIAFSTGATRIIMGSDDAEAGVNTGAVLDQSSGDSNVTNSYLYHYFNQRGDAGYAMYGWGGNDSIVGASYNDTIWGGTGDDTIVGGQGNDRLFGEAGADVFAFSADADISISGAVSHSAAVVVADGGNDTGADQVRDFDATTDFIRITVTSADTTWNIGTHVLVGTADASKTAVGDVGSYLGSTYLVQNGDPSSTSDAFEIAVRVTSDGTATATGSTAAFANASAAQARTMVHLTGTSGADTLTTGANADTVLGMGGNDVITGGAGIDTVDGGDNDDTIIVSSTVNDGTDSLTGGANTDTLKLTGDVAFTGAIIGFEAVTLEASSDLTVAAAELSDNTIASVTGVAGGDTETVTFTGTSAADTINLSGITVTNARLIVTAGDNADIITGSGSADSLSGGAGNDVITGGAGIDTVDGGDNDDTIIVSSTANDGTDSLTGGANTDTLKLTGDVAFTGAIIGFEAVTLEASSDLTVAAAELSDNTIASVTGVAGGDTETVTFTGTSAADTINLSGITVTNARLIVTAGDNADIITGSGSADSLSGGAGNDVITGGAGVDTMDGGAGADTFVYTAATDTGTDPNDLTTMDKIIGLSASDGDVVDLSTFADLDAGSSMVTYVSDDEWLLSWTSSTGTVTNYVLLENTGLSSGLVLTDNGSGVLTADVIQNISATFSDTAVTFTVTEAGAADLIKVGTQAAVAGLSQVTIGGAGSLSYSVTHTSASDAVLGFLQFQPSGGNTRSLVPDGTTYVYTGTSGDDDGTGGVDAMLVTSAIASKASNATLVYSYGHAGNDAIVGFSGVDVIYGGADNDSISGGMGADTMTGGAGFDTFEVDHGHSGGTYNTIDVIDDFVSGDDAVDYSIAPVLYGSEMSDHDLGGAFGTSVAFDAAATLANNWFSLQAASANFYFVGNSNAGGAGGYLFFSLGGDTTFDAAIGFLGIGVVGFDLSDII